MTRYCTECKIELNDDEIKSSEAEGNPYLCDECHDASIEDTEDDEHNPEYNYDDPNNVKDED